MNIDRAYLLPGRERESQEKLSPTSIFVASRIKSPKEMTPYTHVLRNRLLDQRAQNISDKIRGDVRKNLRGMCPSVDKLDLY